MEYLQLKTKNSGKLFSLLNKRDILRKRLVSSKTFLKTNKFTYKELDSLNTKLLKILEKYSKTSDTETRMFGIPVMRIIKIDNWEYFQLKKLDI
jgi:hypothetical protein